MDIVDSKVADAKCEANKLFDGLSRDTLESYSNTRQNVD